MTDAPVHTGDETFDAAFNTFLVGCQDLVSSNWNITAWDAPVIGYSEITSRTNFIRVIRTERGQGKSSHCFVAVDDGSNRKMGAWRAGDVFKCDGWKGPARVARGNIFDEANGLARMSQYGAGYNR